MTPGQIIQKIETAQLALQNGTIEHKTLAAKKANSEKIYK